MKNPPNCSDCGVPIDNSTEELSRFWLEVNPKTGRNTGRVQCRKCLSIDLGKIIPLRRPKLIKPPLQSGKVHHSRKYYNTDGSFKFTGRHCISNNNIEYKPSTSEKLTADWNKVECKFCLNHRKSSERK